ncbi:MAG: hypothetical protein RQ875_09480 [Vicingaceae bacterium]|nr:hypothetical protein [Vicingaceae bacterium]
MKRTNQQNKRLHLYIGLLKIDDDFKKVLCHSFSNGRTIRTSELEVSECERLIAHLKNMVKETDKADKMRKKIISFFHKMGYYTSDSKVDMEAIDVWAKKYGYLKKTT